MIKIWITYLSWCVSVFEVWAGSFTLNNNHSDFNFLDKQNDYKIDFERIEMVRYNPRYMKSYQVVTYKYNRTSAVANLTHQYNIDVGYNLEFVVQAHTFLSNEYRPFPIRFQFNFCNGVSKNILGLGEFGKCGSFTGCPLVKGKLYKFCNWSPNPSKFPPLIPNGRYMLDLQGIYHSTELYLLRGYGTISRQLPIIN